jgi:rhamnopyranosyl-N-acetylglucosaminyl-diphospho-decaprenol beta-1,3/1,4-galactofuranosyltransferase
MMKILAAVVTHNRRELLSRCVDHLLAQTRAPDGILIVNNASTDDTVEMLDARRIPYVTQANLGSAGGWHRAIAHAMEHGYDAVWLMDDDGFPSASALAALEPALQPGVACASSVVLKEDRPDEFVFPFPLLNGKGLPVLWGSPRKVATLAALRELAPDGTYPFAHFFNGALVDVAAARQVGNVNQGFFMFGDEVDYFFRLRQVGKVVSVLNAGHHHPDVSQRPYSPIKVYYYVKNTLTLNRRYFDHVWLRDALALLAVLGRTASRNGVLHALSYPLGQRAPLFYRAIFKGWRSQIGKDFNV